jgi:hypothetical protein
MRNFFTAVALSVAALPIALLATFLLSPVWGWFEAKTGIESLGHSGPATWCFGAVYLVLLVAGFGIWRAFRAPR